MNTLKVLRRWACLFTITPVLLQAQYQLLVGAEDAQTGTAISQPLRLADGGVLGVLRQNGQRSLLRSDLLGQPQWCAVYTHDEPDIYTLPSSFVSVNDGGAFVIHHGSVDYPVSHFMISRLDTEGNVLWCRTYALDILMPSISIMLISGSAHADGTLDLLLTSGDTSGITYVVRLDPQGQVLWARRSPHGHSPLGGYTDALITSDINGDLFVYQQRHHLQAGFLSRIGSGGETIWARTISQTNVSWTYQSASLALDNAGGLYLSGYQMFAPTYKQYMLHLNSTGDLDWYRWVGDGWFDFEMWPSIGYVQNDQVHLGSITRFTCALDGTGVERRVYDFQSFTSGIYNMTIALPMLPKRTGDDLLIGGALRRADPTFGFQWNHPVLMRVPLDLQDACLMDLSMDTAFDTLVPSEFLENIAEPDWIMATCTSAVGALQREVLPLPAVAPLCAVVGVEEMESETTLQVWPTLIPAGVPCQVVVERPATVRLLDALGREVARYSTPATSHSVPTHALAPGGYVLQAVDAAGMPIGTQRVVVE